LVVRQGKRVLWSHHMETGHKTWYQLRDSDTRRGVFRRKDVCGETQRKAMLAVNKVNTSLLLALVLNPQHSMEELYFR